MYSRFLRRSVIVVSSCACLWTFSLFAHGLSLDALDKIAPEAGQKDAEGKWTWYDGKLLTIEGKGWTDTEKYYDRLPAKAKGVVRDPVWGLSRDSAGMCLRFASDANTIAVRWSVTSETLAMPHMPATGVSGLDLYVADDTNGRRIWRWIANGRPQKVANEDVLASGIPEGVHEYLLYLPLYNGTESVELGIPPSATLTKGPARPASKVKPVVFYGTSIVHGGCASRPGMAHPEIVGRMLDRPVINLGFSGNGTLDPEMGTLLAELDAAVYVIDCAPNLGPDKISERTEPFVKVLRAAKPETPIVLVENICYQAGYFLPGTKKSYTDKNEALKAAYEKLLADGVTGLTYVACDNLLGTDGEGTVDGTHPNDLGFQRFAEALTPELRKLLGE